MDSTSVQINEFPSRRSRVKNREHGAVGRNRRVTVERPLLRCRFRAGYLVRGRSGHFRVGVNQPGKGGGSWGVYRQLGVARQRQLGHAGPPPANYVHARYRTRVFQSHPYLIGPPQAQNVCSVLELCPSLKFTVYKLFVVSIAEA